MHGKFNIKIKNGKATLNNDIFLSKKDKDIVIYFTIEGFPYKFSNGKGIEGASYSQVILEKPDKTKIALPKTAVDIDEIILRVTEDIIDEVVEIGDYNFQIKLFDKDGSEISLPIIYNQFHVNSIIDYSEDTSSDVNKGGIGYSHITIGDNIDIFSNDKKYNKTIWNNKDTITAQKMNKIENALYYALDNLIINHTPINKEITLSLDKYQNVVTENDLIVNLPVINFHNEFILYIQTTEVIYVTFKSSEKDYNYRLAKGYYKCRLSYIGTWLIEIIMDNNNLDFDGFASEKNIKDLQEQVKNSLAEFQTKFDNRYADKNHIHDNYIRRINNTKGMLLKEMSGFKGMITEDGNDNKAIRTTKDGLLPYTNLDSSIGSNSKQFLYGYISKLISNELSTTKAIVKNLSIDNEITMNSEGKIKYNPSTGSFELLKNNSLTNSSLSLGYIEVNGTRIYVGTEFPSTARENDILIKIDGSSSGSSGGNTGGGNTGGSTGGSSSPVITRYTITNNLTNVNTTNTSTSIQKDSSYSATLSAYSGYSIQGITVTMGGTNITRSCLSNNKINISSVTGNIIITATASIIQTTSLPKPVFELNSSNFTSLSSSWVDLIGDKTAKINGSVAKINDMVRFNRNKLFVCNISSLNLKSFTMALKISVNPTGSSIPSAGNNVITIGAGTGGDWEDNMACNIFPGIGTQFYARLNGAHTDGVEAKGVVTMILRHDATNKKVILNIGNNKYEKTYKETASTLKYIYNGTNTSCDYKYIKLYNSVFSDTQISELLAFE